MGKTRNTVNKVCKDLGFPFVEQAGRKKQKKLPLWDGKQAHFFSDLGASSRLHELAHWLVEAKENRSKVNYGYRSDSTTLFIDGFVVGAWRDIDCESAASLLGILTEKALGLKWRATARDHGWAEDTDSWMLSGFCDAVRILQDKKLIDGNLKPTFLGERDGC